MSEETNMLKEWKIVESKEIVSILIVDELESKLTVCDKIEETIGKSLLLQNH